MGFQIYRNTNTGLSESNYGYRLALKEERIWNNEKDNEVYIGLCGYCFYHNYGALGEFRLCVGLQNNRGKSRNYTTSRIVKNVFYHTLLLVGVHFYVGFI